MKSGPWEAAEKLLISPGKPEKHTSGAEAHVDFIGFMPGINPRPTARMSFSAACKAPLSLFGMFGTRPTHWVGSPVVP